MPLRHLLLHTRWPALIAHCFIAAILAALHFLQGGVHICKADEAPGLASKMLGGTLVTKQVRGGWKGLLVQRTDGGKL